MTKAKTSTYAITSPFFSITYYLTLEDLNKITIRYQTEFDKFKINLILGESFKWLNYFQSTCFDFQWRIVNKYVYPTWFDSIHSLTLEVWDYDKDWACV